MVKSMTSFGRGKMLIGTREITVEIKSVNNRYFDCQVRMPRIYSCLEQKVKPHLLESGIRRGKVDVSIFVEDSGKGYEEITVNEDYAAKYIAALRALKEMYGLSGEIDVMSVAKNTEVFSGKKQEEDEENDWKELRTVLDVAINAFIESRTREGERIGADLLGKLEGIEKLTEKIKEKSEEDISLYRQKLEDRIKAALQDNNITIDENRILTECAIYADRAAIDEELVRLGSHYCEFRKYMQLEEPVGRSLDFLMQEMNREINTIGSKCQNSDIAHTVVEIKTELEKIREQIQNLE